MRVEQVSRRVDAEHGVVCSFPEGFFGYFGWPTVARLRDEHLVAAASGLRNAHVCPFGRSVICHSHDGGRTWTSPSVVNDSPMDDRDTGIVALGDQRLLLSWFSTDTRRASVYDHYRNVQDQEHVRRYASGFARMTDSSADRWVGSWVRTSSDVGQTWSPPVRVPITAPHGPILLRSGELLYLGKAFLPHGGGPILAFSSRDAGRSWCELGRVPLYPGTVETQYHEPHAVELPDGRFIGLIRLQNAEGAPRLEDIGLTDFSLVQTVSQDAGRTWSPAHPLGFHGSPPHLLRHSSGAVVCVYGYRRPPFGQRAMLSHDGATSWQYDYVLRDDGPDADLGYPSTVELGDGTLLTVYYQKRASAEEKCSILWTRWRLPA